MDARRVAALLTAVAVGSCATKRAGRLLHPARGAGALEVFLSAVPDGDAEVLLSPAASRGSCPVR